MLPFLHALESTLGELNDRVSFHPEKWGVFLAGMAALLLSFVFMPAQVTTAFQLALWLAPVWLPVLLISCAMDLWYIWKRSEFISKQSYILLEIKPPRMLAKTPLAMEAFLSTLHLTGGESTWWQRLMGGTRPFWSLEIVSFEGEVHFYIWGRAALRRLVESQLYAQYPGIQISEAVDYTRLVTAHDDEWSVWGCDHVHTADAPLPIKTYIEYGLDKPQKEPEQVDPLAQLIEYAASFGKGEYLWLQFVIRAHKGERYHGKLNDKGKPFTWIDEANKMVQEIREKTRDVYLHVDPVTGESEERPGFPNPTKGQIEKIAAIERNVSKLAFDVGARSVYLARPENFHGPAVAHMIALFKPFSTEGWNGIKSTKWLKAFNEYPWEFSLEKRKAHYRREMIEAYRRRQYFYDPFYEGGVHADKTMIMSTEELATVFHIPSRSVEAPGLSHVQSATAEAPANLPI